MSSATPTEPEPAVLLRPAVAEDLPEIGELFWTIRTSAAPAMPPPVHLHREVLAFYAGIDLTDGREVWVAEVGDALVGFAELKGDWLDDLYVHPDHQGSGIGTALLDLAKALRPGGFGLWVFESNEPARSFYRRHGFVETERTDGSDNEERAPDIRMEWDGAGG